MPARLRWEPLAAVSLPLGWLRIKAHVRSRSCYVLAYGLAV